MNRGQASAPGHLTLSLVEIERRLRVTECRHEWSKATWGDQRFCVYCGVLKDSDAARSYCRRHGG